MGNKLQNLRVQGLYSTIINGGSENKKCRRVKKKVVKRGLTFDEYVSKEVSMNRIRSRKHL